MTTDEYAIGGDRRRGRGATSNMTGRFEALSRFDCDDGWSSLEDLPPFRTTVTREATRTIISKNDSPDVSFDQSINVYRGCEHGCIYCYARPTHAYMGLSPGLDFESHLFVKPDAAKLFREEISRPSYSVKTVALGTNTDPYQPIEREHRLTRGILEVCLETGHPVGIVTKSAGILRDLDVLSALAARGLVKVALSITTQDPRLARAMEPRASTPARRLAALRTLSEAGVPTAVMTAPLIPGLNDHELEGLLTAARDAGAREAGYVLLRLPREVAPLFAEWLAEHYPDRASRVLALVRQTRGGKTNVARFGERMTGSGPLAALIAQRFRLATARLGLNGEKFRPRTDGFSRPAPEGRAQQLSLF